MDTAVLKYGGIGVLVGWVGILGDSKLPISAFVLRAVVSAVICWIIYEFVWFRDPTGVATVTMLIFASAAAAGAASTALAKIRDLIGFASYFVAMVVITLGYLRLVAPFLHE